MKSYQWSQGNKVLNNSATLVLNNLLAGTYTYTLTVTDSKNIKDSDSVTITVKSKAQPATIKVNIHENRCLTYAGMHLRLESTITGGVTGQGPLHITRYTEANCGGSITALPSFIPSDATVTYEITNITDIGEGKRTGTMTVNSLGQKKSSTIYIDANGNVSQ
jgi:PKD repeat protein